ncbi:hypothetical protein C4559_03015 [Candidatus Microgenomates bacterium]|nr:MAG: hypothetical protein C4559_03015 [Candidatus Microgenomates bacterium]
MITLIHGDDAASSRKYLNEEKQKSNDSSAFGGEKLTLSDLTQVIEGGGLFSDEKNIFIEDFLKRKPGTEFNEIIALVEKNSKSINIYFWESKELTKKQTSLFKSPKIMLFKFPQYVFSLMDSIKPGNGKNLLAMLYQNKNIDIELIFYMLIRQIRLLLVLSDNSNEQIDEVKRMAPWQKSKLQKQSSFFSVDELKNIYKKLYEIDLAQKTGNLNLSLEQTIDILLLDI